MFYPAETVMRGRKGHGEMNTPVAFFRLRGSALVALAIATAIIAAGEHGNALHVIRELGLHDRLQLICVQPLFERWALPWYGNHPSDPRMRYADHLIEVLLPAVEANYRTVPGRAGRPLLGFSKSGWGAVCLLLAHGAVFDAAASFDAPLMLTGRQFGAWGTDKTHGTPDTMDANCPTALARQHAGGFPDRPRLVIAGEKVFGNPERWQGFATPPRSVAHRRVSRSGRLARRSARLPAAWPRLAARFPGSLVE
jgi:hypothetical protein